MAVNARANRLESEGLAGEIEALGGKAIATVADVGDQAQVNAMMDLVIGAFGRVDIPVNNAGMARRIEVRHLSRDRIFEEERRRSLYD